MKKILMYIGGVFLVVAAMPVIFVFAIGGVIVYAKNDCDFDALEGYWYKFTEIVDDVVDWVW